ncbi:MAG: ABC transporter permease [Candidatus Eremiobacterota bacterium]
MDLSESLASALDSLRANKLRSALTMLGVIIGVGLVITLVSLGEAAKAYVNREVGSMGFGSNALVVHPGKMDPPIEPSRLSLSDSRELRRRITGINDIIPVLIGSAQARFGKNEHKIAIWGLTESWPQLANYRVMQGHFFSSADVDRHRKVCVLGPQVQEKLFGGASPIGENLRIGGRRFVVLGVMEPKGEMLGMNMDDMAIVPVTTSQDLLETTRLTELIVWTHSGEDLPHVQAEIATFLRQRHLDLDDFHFHTQTEMLSILGNITGTLTLFVAGIAGISLVVGSIGIMNIMLVSVMERTREIGIRKAVGASDRDLFVQFFMEALVISMGGGLLGIAGGSLVATGIMAGIGMPIGISTWAVVSALISSALVGLASGVYPAMRAARQDPIQALRWE